MRHNTEMTGSIARERLKFMIESGQMENSPNLMERMKKEISEIISRYYDVSAENYEIKVILKQNKKRAYDVKTIQTSKLPFSTGYLHCNIEYHRNSYHRKCKAFRTENADCRICFRTDRDDGCITDGLFRFTPAYAFVLSGNYRITGWSSDIWIICRWCTAMDFHCRNTISAL